MHKGRLATRLSPARLAALALLAALADLGGRLHRLRPLHRFHLEGLGDLADLGDRLHPLRPSHRFHLEGLAGLGDRQHPLLRLLLRLLAARQVLALLAVPLAPLVPSGLAVRSDL